MTAETAARYHLAAVGLASTGHTYTEGGRTYSRASENDTWKEIHSTAVVQPEDGGPLEEEYLAAVAADEQRRDAGQQPWALALAAEVNRQRVREEAARVLRRERADAAGEPTPVLLSDFLAVPDDEVAHRVDGLWPVGGRVVFAAQYKAGKTTLRDNLVRALVDEELFLGRFTVNPPQGRVVIIDNELDERMLRRWLRDQGVRHSERVAVIPLRGRVASFDLLDDDTRARWAAKLRAIEASVVLFDCLRPVLDALGLSEDKEAGRFLVAFDALLAEAGASEAVVVHHMGHAGERSRGDTRLRDWPDVEWQLLREKTDDDEQTSGARRFFAAYGRDVDHPEGLLDYDHMTRRLTLAGGTRRDARADADIPQILAYLGENPGATQRGVEVALGDLLGGPKAARATLKRAVAADLVDVAEGPRRSHLHFLKTPSAPSAPTSAPAHPAQSRDECASAPLGGARRTHSADEPQRTDLDPAHSALTEA